MEIRPTNGCCRRDHTSVHSAQTDSFVDRHVFTLIIEAKATMGEYKSELMAMADEDQRVKGRKRDFGPMIHTWVTKLADKGLLEDIINET